MGSVTLPSGKKPSLLCRVVWVENISEVKIMDSYSRKGIRVGHSGCFRDDSSRSVRLKTAVAGYPFTIEWMVITGLLQDALVMPNYL